MRYDNNQQYRIVIVGGGVGGLLLAVRLGHFARKNRNIDVVLVDRSFSHVWKPMLHSLAAGTTKASTSTIAFIPFAQKHGFRFVHGEVASLDKKNKTLSIAPRFDEQGPHASELSSISYDAIVFALGSKANDFNTPGIAQHCLYLDTLDGAQRINEVLRQATYDAYLEDKPLTMAVVGGGATGVQLVGELRKLIGSLSHYGIADRVPSIELVLLEATPRILPAMPEKISRDVTRQMQALGIKVEVNAMVSSADEEGFTLKDGKRIDAQIKIWAAGVKGTEGADKLGDLPRQRNGQIIVQDTLQSQEDPSILAIGDCAFIEGNPIAPTAQAARQQALHLARYMPQWILEGKSLPKFTYHNRGTVIALNEYNGWGVTGGGKVFGGGPTHGLTARLAHKALYHQHFIELLGPIHGGAAMCADFFNAYVHPDIDLK